MTADEGVRLRVNATTLALLFALMGNGAALVWGAATISATVTDVKATTDKLDRTLAAVGQNVQNLRERVGVLEDRGNRTQSTNPLQPAHP